MSRLSLPNGDWVDFSDRLNYAQSRRMVAAEGTPDQSGTFVAAMVTNWALRDVHDQPIDFPGAGAEGIALDALSRIPIDTFMQMGIKAAEIDVSQLDPKGLAGTLPGSQSEESSKSQSRSPRRTSSRTTQAGTGTTYNGHPPR